MVATAMALAVMGLALWGPRRRSNSLLAWQAASEGLVLGTIAILAITESLGQREWRLSILSIFSAAVLFCSIVRAVSIAACIPRRMPNRLPQGALFASAPVCLLLLLVTWRNADAQFVMLTVAVLSTIVSGVFALGIYLHRRRHEGHERTASDRKLLSNAIQAGALIAAVFAIPRLLASFDLGGIHPFFGFLLLGFPVTEWILLRSLTKAYGVAGTPGWQIIYTLSSVALGSLSMMSLGRILESILVPSLSYLSAAFVVALLMTAFEETARTRIVRLVKSRGLFARIGDSSRRPPP
jgi:hypothetical protein